VTRYTIACIVEGHAEVDALPILIRRVLPHVHVPRPVRGLRTKLHDINELSRLAAIADSNIRSGGRHGGILALFDADDDCAATLGPRLQRELTEKFGHRMTRLVLPVNEFESWLIAGRTDAPVATDETRATKTWLRRQLGRYSPTADQPSLTAEFDLKLAARMSRSFQRFLKVLNDFKLDAESVAP